MANKAYVKSKKLLLDGDIDLLVDDIRVILVDTADYTLDETNHDFLDDVPAAARVAVSGSLTGKSTTGGVFDASDTVFSAVSGDPSEALIIYKHTGTASTSPLIVYLDTGYSGLPITPNGGDINLLFPNDANKIFAITG